MKKKLNCWEYWRCGCEPNGKSIKKLGECPVPLLEEYDGINNGFNAGRCCWMVAGTSSSRNIKGIIAQQITNCIECPFFKKVKDEEKLSP